MAEDLRDTALKILKSAGIENPGKLLLPAYEPGWVDPREELTKLVDKWGQTRVDEVIQFLVKSSKDHKGLLIVMHPTPDQIDKVLSAIYMPEAITVDPEFVVISL